MVFPGGGINPPLHSPINFPPVSHPDNKDGKTNIFDRINYAVFPVANSIEVVVALELLGSRRAGIG